MDIAPYTQKKRVIVLETATTGVQPNDRIVTLGAVRLEGDELQRQSLYLIFDPRKDSHPEAAEIHGYDDWITRFQDMFSHLAPRIYSWLSWADELVMHDAAFDLPYLQREFRKAKLAAIRRTDYSVPWNALGKCGGTKQRASTIASSE